MIYSAEIKDFPDSEKSSEISVYNDQNGTEWRFAMVKNGFFIGYFGDDYFKEKEFEIDDGDKIHYINNTGCFFVKTLDFDVYYEFRNIVNEGFTDDIWEAIEEFIQLRFELSGVIMTCEKDLTN